MTGGLLGWLQDPSRIAGLRFLADDGAWQSCTYAELATLVRATAHDLRDHGLTTGQTVVVLCRTGPAFAASFFGVLAAGGTPVPLAPPVALGDSRGWLQHAAHVINESGASMLIADPDLTATAAMAAPASCPVLPPALARDRPYTPWPAAELAVLQFTSGSRGRARGVRVSAANLEANIAMIERRWHGPSGGTGVSWLPLHHDLGLVFGLLTPVVRQISVGLMRPEQFIQQPLRWLREYDGGSGQVMLMPNFGFGYLLRRIRPGQLDGLDLSGVEAVVTGAERIRLDVATSFLERLRSCGLRPEALKPAYGLAEATLGVTCVLPGVVPQAVSVAAGPTRLGEPVRILARAPMSPQPPSGEGIWHVSCGTPLDGLEVRIVDDLGQPLPDGRLGEIEVRGPSVALGYTRTEEDTSTRFADGTLFTGDAGFMVEGELYVTGRIGDSLQVRGRNVYVEDLEHALADHGPYLPHRTVVLAGNLGDVPNVWVITAAPITENAVEYITPLVGPDVAIRVVKVPASAIELTTSGKPRRRLMWQRVLSGELDGQVMAESQPAAVPS